jgi:porin
MTPLVACSLVAFLSAGGRLTGSGPDEIPDQGARPPVDLRRPMPIRSDQRPRIDYFDHAPMEDDTWWMEDRAFSKRSGGLSEGNETAFEIFYKVQVLPWLSVQPDVQYIVNPGGDGEDAVAIGLRLETTL